MNTPDTDAILREHLRKIAAKGGSAKTAAKVAACKLNLAKANAAKKARKA